MKNFELKKQNFDALYTKVTNEKLNDQEVLRVEKIDKIDIYDENTYAKLKDIKFRNGIIKVKMLSRLLPNAPDFARGFIGIVFRVNEDDSEFESYYVRPTNGRHPDPIRRSHGSQYFSFPGYTFSYFREFGIDKYEAPVDIDLDEWIDLKAIFKDEYAEFYVNDMDKPSLIVDKLKHGSGEKGYFGFYVDTGTEAFFKDLVIEILD